MNVRLTDEQKIRIANSDQLYEIMQKVLMRENYLGRQKEHFWTVSLNTANKIVNVELSALGSLSEVALKPRDVFRLALIKGASKVILVHNHPSGKLEPSKEDLDITDRLIQVGKIIELDIMDHFIISEDDYVALAGTKHWGKLMYSNKYVVDDQRQVNEIRRELTKELKKKHQLDTARLMKAEGESVERIILFTGLSRGEIENL